ncbi:MAG: ammonium transporter [Chloroflexi bacterium]|nr:ammonium transporter [Chloroflexota bacterium]
MAGLVAITAPCAFVSPGASVIIGLIAGVLVCLATFGLEKIRIDDPVGAVPVHLVNGIWGIVAVGLFANGNPASAGWNGVTSPVTGLFYGGSGQLMAQLFTVGAILVVACGLSLAFFKALSLLKILRSEPHDELVGLDIPEMVRQVTPMRIL